MARICRLEAVILVAQTEYEKGHSMAVRKQVDIHAGKYVMNNLRLRRSSGRDEQATIALRLHSKIICYTQAARDTVGFQSSRHLRFEKSINCRPFTSNLPNFVEYCGQIPSFSAFSLSQNICQLMYIISHGRHITSPL